MNRYRYTYRYAWAFCLSCASVLAWLLPPLVGSSPATAIPIAPISADDDDRRGDSGGGDHFQIVHNFNKDPEVIRLLEPFKRIANALGVSDRINDMSFDLGLVFEEETYNPLFSPQAGTYHNAEIWGVPVQIDIFNVMDFRPYFEWVRRTTDDPEVLTFYQELEETPVSFYQFDCWVRTFWGQEFFLSATSIVPDQKEVPICLAVIDPNDKESGCKFTWPNYVLLPQEIIPPESTMEGAPTTPYEYSEWLSNPELAYSAIDAASNEDCISMCKHCPPGSPNIAFCPGCLPEPYQSSMDGLTTMYGYFMETAEDNLENCLTQYLDVLGTVLCRCFKICPQNGFLRIPKIPRTPVVIACLILMGVVAWFILDCYEDYWDAKSENWEFFSRGFDRLYGLYCTNTPP